MSTQFTPTPSRKVTSNNYADALVGQARAVEADSTFAHSPGLSTAVFIVAGLLFVVGAIAAAWAIFRVLAHA
ncbi:MAG TPA: hypothetical protein VM008_10905 [Phycisphaerae bacterium]|nr:hypothetical protein [Phycisphaerae bacterium]